MGLRDRIVMGGRNRLVFLVIPAVTAAILFVQQKSLGAVMRDWQEVSPASAVIIGIGVDIDITAIVKQRELTSPNAVRLLKAVAARELEYDQDRDFLVFEHIMKTGGTSLSDVMIDKIGSILPGSHRSGVFQASVLEDALLPLDHPTATVENNSNLTREEWWNEKKAMYSHSALQEKAINGSVVMTKKFGKWFQTMLPATFSKTIKVMTIVRDPLHLVASNMNEWMCFIKLRRKQAKKRLELWRSQECSDSNNNKPSSCPPAGLNSTVLGDEGVWKKFNASDPCFGLDLEFLAKDWVEHELKPLCLSNATKTSREEEWCKIYLESGADPMPHCHSPERMLNDTIFGPMMQQGMYPHLIQPIENGTVADYEDEALRDLGGLSDMTYNFWWIGVTERMHESMCLLHHALQIPFVEETPMERYTPCRPTSWWTEAEKALVRERNSMDYALVRAANAVLDVRVAKMCHDIKAEKDRNNGATFVFLPDSCCG